MGRRETTRSRRRPARLSSTWLPMDLTPRADSDLPGLPSPAWSIRAHVQPPPPLRQKPSTHILGESPPPPEPRPDGPPVEDGKASGVDCFVRSGQEGISVHASIRALSSQIGQRKEAHREVG